MNGSEAKKSSRTLECETFLHKVCSRQDGGQFYLDGSFYELSACCHKNHDFEKPNQDAGIIIPLSKTECLLVIADGMGGHRCGDRASKIACDILRDEVRSGNNIIDSILYSIEQIHEEIKELAVGAGSTICVAYVEGNTVRTFHVGDSSIVVFNRLGRIKYQTLNHSPVSYAVASGLLSEKQANTHPEKHLLSNALGIDDVYISVGLPVEFNEHDVLVLMTDGVTDHHAMDDIFQIIKGKNLKQAMSDLVDNTTNKIFSPQSASFGHNDDSTAILFRLVKNN